MTSGTHLDFRQPPMRRYLAGLPQGRKAARAGGLYRVRGGPLLARTSAEPGLAAGRVVLRPRAGLRGGARGAAAGDAQTLAPPGRAGRAVGRRRTGRDRSEAVGRGRAADLLP